MGRILEDSEAFSMLRLKREDGLCHFQEPESTGKDREIFLVPTLPRLSPHLTLLDPSATSYLSGTPPYAACLSQLPYIHASFQSIF